MSVFRVISVLNRKQTNQSNPEPNQIFRDLAIKEISLIILDD